VRRPALLLVVLALVGCSFDGESGSGVSAADGPKLVLAEEDVGRPFVQFDVGEQRRTDMAPPRDDPDRFHREGGWKARFQRGGGVQTQGPLVIESRADLFESAGDADEDFGLYEEALDGLASGAGGQGVEVPPESQVGEEGKAVTFTQGAAQAAVRYYYYAWRQGPVTASVSVNGFDGKTTLSDVVELAKEQEARIERELGES
jgi:hypothetical protein